MSDETTTVRPIPKPRTGIASTKANQQSTHVHPTYNTTVSAGAGSGYRYQAPVTPTSTVSSSWTVATENPLKIVSPDFGHQTSTPLPGSTTYNPPSTPPTQRLTFAHPKYSGPKKVMTPNSNENTFDGSFTRKDSHSSSRSSFSSEPPSPLRCLSEEIEVKNNEIARLTKCKTELESDCGTKSGELNELKRECEEYENNVEELMKKETLIKRRIAQLNQLEQMESEKEQSLRNKENELKERELLLNERSTKIRNREIELQSESDLLFEKRKELEIREYDLKNFGGHIPSSHGGGGAHSDALAHEEREREIQKKEEELFHRENRLNEFQARLKKEEERLKTWEENVRHEDNRVQQNMKLFKEKMKQTKRLEDDALSATKIAAMMEDERTEKGMAPFNSNTVGVDKMVTVNGSYKMDDAKKSTGGASNTTPYGVSATPTYGVGATPISPPAAGNEGNESTDNDEVVARLMNLKINADIYKEDSRVAKEIMTREHERRDDPPVSSDDEIALRMQLDFMGINPDNMDIETMRQRIKDEMDRQERLNQVTLRDEEIAMSMRDNNDDNYH